jgi:hypothetical protein
MAARSKPLRVVAAGEKPPARTRKRKMTITQAAARGTVRDQLVALRDRVAKTVEDPNCPPRDLAALTRRLMEITKEIDAIDVRDAEDSGGAGAATPDDEWEAV